MSKIANVSPQTVRNYTREYGHLLSPKARGEAGQRLFSDDDVQVFCAIVDLRKSGVPPGEVTDHIRNNDVVIDVAPQAAPQNATEGPQAPQLPQIAQYSPQAFVEALERHHARHTARMYWSHVRAFLAGVVTMALAFYLAWLLVNGPW